MRPAPFSPPTRRVILGLGLTALALGLAPGPAAAAPQDGWIIPARRARALLAEGAVLFDARGRSRRWSRPLPGAVAVGWPMFTEPERPHRGKLLSDDAVLTTRLRALGVSAAQAVVVVADSRASWGEDGRIVWTLRSLGHDRSYMVDGGVDALLAGGPVAVAPVAPGDFTVARTGAYNTDRDQVRAALGQSDVVILDVREPREYAGETPYGEARGGHLPGARSLFYRDLLAPGGTVLPEAALRARLSALGIGRDTKVIAYCTTGIRAGFVTAVLQDAGIDARNYAGSMTEWAAAPAAAYPLVQW
jgi:thiosulfate/3-mercaptopyruvate sulfurtransferase